MGLELDAWQAYCLDLILGERADGRWAAFEAGVLVARQNGKGGILEAVELAGLFLFGEQLILHSAHEFKTAQEAFRRVRALVEGSPELSKHLAKVYTSHGQEGIELRSGARLRFVARSKGSARGFSGDRLILDEAQELPIQAIGAMLPALSARPNPQVVYTGTVPTPENDSEHWESVRDRGRAGEAGLVWVEWSPVPRDDDLPPDLDDPKVWVSTNPAIDAGRDNGITIEAVERERRSLPDDVFARERLSYWPDGQGAGAISMVRWDRLTDPTSKIDGPLAFGVDVPYDRESGLVSIVAAGRRGDGRVHVELVEAKPGTTWVPERLAELAKHDPVAVGLDVNGPAGELADLLAGLPVVRLSGRDMAAAAGGFLEAVNDQRVAHLGDEALRSSVAVAARRPQGETWVWRRKGEQFSTGLIGASVAVWSLDHPPEDGAKKRSGVVW